MSDAVFAAPSEHPSHIRYDDYGSIVASGDRDAILKLCEDLNVRFLRLIFIDINGFAKNVEVPTSKLEDGFDAKVMFDGSSIAGYVRIEESDMLLRPDLDTFRIFPWGNPDARVGQMYCDVRRPYNKPFGGCPRAALKRVVARAEAMGYTMYSAVEAEFFLFNTNDDGSCNFVTHDNGGYFDLTPSDLAERARREMVTGMEAMGLDIEAAHHEVAEGQHEIDFKYGEALRTADDLMTFKFIVRNIAHAHGLHATFMPKPIFGANGSGMHTHQSLFKDGKNIFHDPDADYQLAEVMLHYIGGLKKHARAIAAVTNPIVNSYKRLVPGYEAPISIAWSQRNRSPMIRIPEQRGVGTRLEFRMPDPSCNGYLATAVQLAAGLDGIENKIDPGPPLDTNVWKLSAEERARIGLEVLPANLGEAVEELEANEVMKDALGDHIFEQFVSRKKAEWSDYVASVSEWELEQYVNY
ncbi:MAG: type I glutamate--ammonia ligase [Gemmatimonadales bacterium]|nr:type I glutamate--ammonia ligase [Candidatus Palauibacter irciniicola]MYC19163.1 type I glutamate--ammonia ligase [Gemmatimonadales bacterium]